MKVHVYNSMGKLVGPVESARVVKSDEQWQRELTREQYEVARGKGTEQPFCGDVHARHAIVRVGFDERNAQF